RWRPARCARPPRRACRPRESPRAAGRHALPAAAWGGCFALLRKREAGRRAARGGAAFSAHPLDAREIEKVAAPDWSLTIDFIRYVTPDGKPRIRPGSAGRPPG